MSETHKKYQQAYETLRSIEIDSLVRAIETVKKLAYAKFDESIDVDIILGIDPSKGEQTVRGSVLLPHGTGKKVRVLVFAKGEYIDQAKEAGADYVGMDDLIKKISEGWIDFDVAVSTPDLMGIVGQVAPILGPKGLLPNKKEGTITFDVATIVSELKKGRITYKNDKGGNVHVPFGKISFETKKLVENLSTLIKSLIESKPATAKGKFIKKITISSTMGVGVEVKPEYVI